MFGEAQQNFLIPLIEQNPALCDVLIAIISTILGVISIFIGIERYIKRHREEARYGFYINLMVRLKQLSCMLDQYPLITQRLVRSDILSPCANEDHYDEIAPRFANLCRDFLDFLTSASNNIPPVGKKHSAKWNEWYENIYVIVDYIQKCTFVDSRVFLFIDRDDYNTFIDLETKAKEAMKTLESQLERVIKG